MKLFDRARAAVARKGYSPRAEEAYTSWIVRYIRFHGARHPEEMAEEEIAGFLTHLAVEQRMSASSRNQALSGVTTTMLYLHLVGCGAYGVRSRLDRLAQEVASDQPSDGPQPGLAAAAPVFPARPHRAK